MADNDKLELDLEDIIREFSEKPIEEKLSQSGDKMKDTIPLEDVVQASREQAAPEEDTKRFTPPDADDDTKPFIPVSSEEDTKRFVPPQEAEETRRFAPDQGEGADSCLEDRADIGFDR